MIREFGENQIEGIYGDRRSDVVDQIRSGFGVISISLMSMIKIILAN